MYAVFEVSGFQYRGEEGEVLKIALRPDAEGEKLDIDKVLLVKTGDSSIVGTTFIEGARVETEVVKHGKGDKVEIYKYRRRTKYRRRQGHRQDYTEVRIRKIVTP